MSVDYAKLPEHIQASVRRYIEEGSPVGSFLSAVISNNLTEAFDCADDINEAHMKEIVGFFYYEAPAHCWGSPGKMSQWIELHRKKREKANT